MRLDLPVQVDHPAANSLMVLPLENLMVLPKASSAASRSKRGRFRVQTLREQHSNLEAYRLTLWWFAGDCRSARRSETADFKFRGSATRIRTWNLPVNSLMES
jgi:hypothetical protein